MSLPSLHLLRLGPSADTGMPGMSWVEQRRARAAEQERVAKEAREKAVEAARLANAPERPEGALDTVRLLVLDFDHTLTFVKTFTVAGVASTASSKNAPLFKNMTKEQHIENFGGEEAVAMMHTLFGKVLEKDIEIRILSDGSKEAIVHALDEVGLLEYFTSTDEDGTGDGDRVFGNNTPLGFHYTEDEGEEGTEEVILRDVDKAAAIQGWRDQFELWMDEIAFLDSDDKNLTDPTTGMQGVLEEGQYWLAEHPLRDDALAKSWIEMITGLVTITEEQEDREQRQDDEQLRQAQPGQGSA